MAAPQIIQPVDSQSGWGLVPALDGSIGTATPDPATGVSATSTQQGATATTQALIQAQTVPPVPASVPMLDANGYISPAWSAYFQSLMRRIGGYADIPWEDLFILGEQDTPLPDATARDMAQLSTLEVPQTPCQVVGDPFDAPRFPVAPDVDPFQIDRTVRVPDEDPFAGIIYPEARVFGKSGATHRIGLVPDPGSSAGATKFLREDGTWAAAGGTSVGTITFPMSKLVSAYGGMANSGGSYALGSRFISSVAQTCVGLTFYGYGSLTYVCKLWDDVGNQLATANVTTTTAGIYSSSWTGVALSANTMYRISFWESTGTWYNQGNSAPIDNLTTAPVMISPYVLSSAKHYGTGNSWPGSLQATSGVYFPVDPLFS